MSDPFAERKSLLLLVLVSAAALLLEMILIRWVASEVRVFAYMPNQLLVACFLGMGLGCYRASRQPRWTRGLLALAFIVFVVTDPFSRNIRELVTQGVAVAEDSFLWNVPKESIDVSQRLILGVCGIGMTVVLLVVTALVLEPFGQLLGVLFEDSPRPLLAYSANLLGSLLGTWGFFVLSAFSTGPVVWFTVAAILVLPLVYQVTAVRPGLRLAQLCLLLTPIALVVVSDVRSKNEGTRTIWSPYQKLDVTPLGSSSSSDPLESAGYHIQVNNTSYQDALNLSWAYRSSHPNLLTDGVFNNYDMPYQVLPRVERILIVGAGTGNDVAAALRTGNRQMQIDAVEIDPEIQKLGFALHPERPYDSSQVRPILDDARSFFKRAERNSYDVIWYGSLDSHTTGNAFSTLRLDHFVYTLESFQEARELLRPGGVIVCTFALQRPWTNERIFGLLRTTFDGVAPISLFYGDQENMWGAEVFFAGSEETLDRIRAAFGKEPALAEFFQSHETHHEGAVRLSDDDWPYLYLREPRIPTSHLVVSAAILFVCFRLRRGSSTVNQPIAWPFFFLGAAFLLLEVLGVSRAALLFGSTWVVTAVVVSGVLTMALLANGWVAIHPSRSLAVPLVGLLVFGALLLTLPLDLFAPLPQFLKILAAGAFLAAPLYFSGLLFARLFRDAPHKDVALGSNLFGAIAGGLCGQASFLFGMKVVTAFALVLYVLAVMSALGQARTASGESGDTAGIEPAAE